VPYSFSFAAVEELTGGCVEEPPKPPCLMLYTPMKLYLFLSGIIVFWLPSGTY